MEHTYISNTSLSHNKKNKHLILLKFLEPLPPSGNILLPALQVFQTLHPVSSSRCVDVPNRAEWGLHPTGHISQQSLEIAHPPLVDN